jgi:hypothetical protein
MLYLQEKNYRKLGLALLENRYLTESLKKGRSGTLRPTGVTSGWITLVKAKCGRKT